MAPDDPMISASEAKELMEKHLKRKVSLNRVVRLMLDGKIPSEKSIYDARKRLARKSDVMKWIQEVLEQEGSRAALAFA